MESISTTQMLIIITIAAAATIVTRATPFLLFQTKPKETNGALQYIGFYLPLMVMPCLVVYSLKDYDFSAPHFGLAPILGLVVCVGSYHFYRNLFVSIAVGMLAFVYSSF